MHTPCTLCVLFIMHIVFIVHEYKRGNRVIVSICYQKLHTMGYSYRDISFGNMFFDPDTGDVLICDNDNVSANGIDNSSVYGTPRFMAPEIVMGQAKPSRNTDLYSLAVLLFYMFMMGHPLEGKLEAEIKCMDIHAMNKLYGKNPIFIYDPNDKSNRPVKGYQDNVIIYWELYPQVIRDLFIKSFEIRPPINAASLSVYCMVIALIYDVHTTNAAIISCSTRTAVPWSTAVKFSLPAN